MASQNRDSDESASENGAAKRHLCRGVGSIGISALQTKMDEEEVFFGQPDCVSVMKQRKAEQVVVNGVI